MGRKSWPKSISKSLERKGALGGGIVDLRNIEVTVIVEMLSVKCKLRFSS